jgi:hypothetical protein
MPNDNFLGEWPDVLLGNLVAKEARVEDSDTPE